MDDDLERLSRPQLIDEVKRLRAAIRAHRDASGNNLCWHHPALWSLLPEPTLPASPCPTGHSSCAAASATGSRSTSRRPRHRGSTRSGADADDERRRVHRPRLAPAGPPGHDAARLQALGTGWRLDGCAVFVDTSGPCLVTYMVDCDAAWRTTAVRVAGWAGTQPIAIDLRADTGRRWTLNGRDVPAVDGCDDVDLSFTPATNLLPIRRLRLAEGTRTGVRAAWLAFPALELEPLEQVYAHLGGGRYRYESERRLHRRPRDPIRRFRDALRRPLGRRVRRVTPGAPPASQPAGSRSAA